MQGKTIVYDAITVKREGGFAFDVWHQNHYLPSMLAGGPLLNVQCYLSPLRATYVAVFESNASAATLHGLLPAAEHESILSTERHVAGFMNEQQAPGAIAPFREAAILYPVLFHVPAEGEKDFNAWYDEEHLGILLRSPYWPMCRRFKIYKPQPQSWTHIALHYLTDLRALESKERDEARATPWRALLAQHAWFKGDYRVLYKAGPRRLPDVKKNIQ
ncbi:MAG: hypothetical protein FJY56_14370 [Betaproteobacteria bacterium]|nr:hypothetical protein [Betaproteobacteria bacterium]